MKVLMLESLNATLDGLTVQKLESGSRYSTPDTTVGDRMAAALIRKGAAKPVPESVEVPHDAPAPAVRATKRKAK